MARPRRLVAGALVVLCACSSGGRQANTPTTAAATPPTNAPATTTPATTTAAPPLSEPLAAADDRGLADQIVAAQRAIADPATPGAVLQRQAHQLQVAYRALANTPARRAPTLALLPPASRAAAEKNVTAGAGLRAMVTPRTSLPKWHIVPPAPADELRAYYEDAQKRFGVPWTTLAAIHLVETRMGRIRGNSSAGAQGPMQFLPSTWQQYGAGGDINSNRDAILAAARYLQRNGAPGDMRRALWNYNHDYRYVDAVTAYAELMAADERAYLGYHAWQVYYLTVNGDVWLPEGFVNN
jgi:hypothetical protein